MKGYKGFSKGLVCRGKQYAENTVFEENEAIICESGIHFCKDPWDVLEYYPLIANNGDMNEFAEVESLDKPVTDDSKKFSTTKLKIGAKLSLKGFIEVSINFLFKKNKIDSIANDDRSGYNAQLASSGDNAQLASSGDNAQLASSGYNAQLASSGDNARLASSGDYAQLASSGDNAQLASSGYNAQLASSGDYAQLASSGDYAQLASSGDNARLASSGDYAQLASSGDYSIVCGIGINNIAKASVGSWITLSEYDANNIIKFVKTEYVDGERIKADTWYRLIDGEFKEVTL